MSPKGELKLRSIRPIAKAEIPDRNKGGIIAGLVELQDLEEIAKYVKANGAGVSEGWDVLDPERLKKTNPEAAKMKTLLQGVLLRGREILEKYQVNKKLRLLTRNGRIYLESLE
jgi:hypothetical protein